MKVYQCKLPEKKKAEWYNNNASSTSKVYWMAIDFVIRKVLLIK